MAAVHLILLLLSRWLIPLGVRTKLGTNWFLCGGRSVSECGHVHITSDERARLLVVRLPAALLQDFLMSQKTKGWSSGSRTKTHEGDRFQSQFVLVAGQHEIFMYDCIIWATRAVKASRCVRTDNRRQDRAGNWADRMEWLLSTRLKCWYVPGYRARWSLWPSDPYREENERMCTYTSGQKSTCFLRFRISEFSQTSDWHLII